MACDSSTVEALILSQWFIKVTVHFTVNDILDILDLQKRGNYIKHILSPIMSQVLD